MSGRPVSSEAMVISTEKADAEVSGVKMGECQTATRRWPDKATLWSAAENTDWAYRESLEATIIGVRLGTEELCHVRILPAAVLRREQECR